jgi:hypothetical protein
MDFFIIEKKRVVDRKGKEKTYLNTYKYDDKDKEVIYYFRRSGDCRIYPPFSGFIRPTRPEYE